jgi:hypothetical protein
MERDLLVKLPWTAPGAYLAEELDRRDGSFLDLDGAFRRHLASDGFRRSELEWATDEFSRLDRCEELRGARLRQLYDLARYLVVLRLRDRAALADEFAHRVSASSTWYYTDGTAVPRFDLPIDAPARPRTWGRIAKHFLSFIQHLGLATRARQRLRCIVVEPSQLPFAVLLAQSLRRRAPATSLRIERWAWPGGEAALARAFAPALARADADFLERAPRAHANLGRPPRRELEALERGGESGAVRLFWSPTLDRRGALPGTPPGWLTRAGGRLALSVRLRFGNEPLESRLFGVLDFLLEIAPHLRHLELRAHRSAPGSGTPEALRHEAHTADMLEVQLGAEAEALRGPREGGIADGVLIARPSCELASRYPLDELAGYEAQPDARRRRFGRDARFPKSAAARASKRRRYRLFAESNVVLRAGASDRFLGEVVDAFERARSARPFIRAAVARREWEEAELVDCLETLTYAGVLERRS